MSDTKSFLRKWTKTTSSTPFVFYDLGETQWFLQNDGSVKTYKIVNRKVLPKDSKNPMTVLEEVLLLPEMAVPLEAHQQEVTGWEILETPLFSQPLEVSSSQTTRSKEEYNKRQQPVPQEVQSLTNQTLHEKLLQSGSESGEEPLLQQIVTLPTELWLSLSQWIPPNALFQPSLHHQAILELSDIPTQTSLHRSSQGTYSRPQQGRHQYGARGMPPRYVHGVSGVFSHKPRVHQQDFLMNSVKPLFI